MLAQIVESLHGVSLDLRSLRDEILSQTIYFRNSEAT